jgi:hypothetical protein
MSDENAEITSTAKASSCLETGELDGWEVAAGFSGEMDTSGSTRLCATAPTNDLGRVHQALLAVLQPPLSVLYRQKIDRRDPKPQGDPGKDFVALELRPERVLEAVRAASTLFYNDARAELWVRGALQEQVVLDQDGTLYCYPDDPVFRDALVAAGLSETPDLETLEKRDYVRHWFRAEADAEEDAFLAGLQLTQVPVQR